MSKSPTDRIAAKSFSQVFEQMCNFVAVAKTGHPRETIKGLIQLCLLELPEERFGGAQEFADAIDTLFGVGVPEVQIEAALEDLVRSNVVACPAGTNFVLSTAARAQLESKVTDSRGLEERVKATWFESLARVHSDLALDTAWATLRTYLSRAFRRHGIQAAALLDPTIETPGDHSESLSVLLQEAVTDSFPEKDREPARQAISRFLAEVGADVDRSRYITQLADGAFNFYTLEVAPELASQLRAKLKPLTLFLDTNFLFGILDLHNNSQVEVSLELIRAVQVHKLPFKLRFHECTSQEMLHTISFYGDALRTRQWSRSLSRAATKTQNLSGIEMKFHEKNSGGLIDVDEFMRPYRHFDELLKEKGIQIYRPTDSRLQARADLHHEYQQFLDHCQRKDKAYSTVEHDVTVLDAVRQVRSNAKSTLEAGAILVSCDYLLYRFDWESARRDGHMACVMLPNTLWQLLRPFIPSDRDFDKSFAETFALPEFRAIGSGATRLARKCLGFSQAIGIFLRKRLFVFSAMGFYWTSCMVPRMMPNSLD